MPTPNPETHIWSFYKFHPIEPQDIDAWALALEEHGSQLNLKGLTIMGTEGVNSTICGSPEALKTFTDKMCQLLGFQNDLRVKKSLAENSPFKRFKVKARSEIVTLGKPDVQPLSSSATHLSPEEWHQALQDEDVIVVDTRNWYETKLGKFKNAVDPKLDEFQQWPDYLQKSTLPKDKKILIYCTGGIRCEKAIVEMHNQGFEKVYQLDGGILNYLQKFPEQSFEGECFVFDHRVAVDQHLQPSQKYKMCPHCGQPGETVISCLECQSKAIVCDLCLQETAQNTCSKNCAYHYQRKHS